jgi:hypothetical protein
MKRLLVLSIILISCTSAAPKRDFSVRLYESDYNCLEYAVNGELFTTCRGDDNHPNEKEIKAISIKDYKKERDFQDLLINRCKKWKN